VPEVEVAPRIRGGRDTVLSSVPVAEDGGIRETQVGLTEEQAAERCYREAVKRGIIEEGAGDAGAAE